MWQYRILICRMLTFAESSQWEYRETASATDGSWHPNHWERASVIDIVVDVHISARPQYSHQWKAVVGKAPRMSRGPGPPHRHVPRIYSTSSRWTHCVDSSNPAAILDHITVHVTPVVLLCVRVYFIINSVQLRVHSPWKLKCHQMSISNSLQRKICSLC